MKTFLNIFIGVMVGLAMTGLILVATRGPQGQSVELRSAPTAEPLRVHVAGAVVRPGVYELGKNSRVEDAIDAAGGFVVGADENALNLAAILDDGQRLDVPFVEGFVPEDTSGFLVLPPDGTPAPFDNGDLINLNTASAEELDKLPGIGPTIAQRIIDYRNQNGPFGSIDDIINVPGIGSATFEEIKDLITVGE